MATEVKKLHFRAVRMLTATTLLWAVSFPVVKGISMIQQRLLPESSSWFHASLTSAVRFGIAAIVLSLFVLPTLRRISRLELSQGLGLGFFAGGGILLQMDGLSYTSVSVSAFLTQTFCVWVPVLVALRDQRLPPFRVLLAVVLVLAGVAVLTNFSLRQTNLGRGEWQTLLSAVFFAAQIVWLERPCFSRNDPTHFSIVMFLTMALMSLPILFFCWQQPNDVLVVYRNGTIVVLTAALILFCTLGAFVLMNRWQPFVPATEAAVIYGAEPVIAILFALFLPAWISHFGGVDYANEQLSSQIVIGGTLIILANLYLQLGWASVQPDNPQKDV